MKDGVNGGGGGVPSVWGGNCCVRNAGTLGLKLNKIFITLKGIPTVSIHHIIKSNEHY
jgi:hypothetical protein